MAHAPIFDYRPTFTGGARAKKCIHMTDFTVGQKTQT